MVLREYDNDEEDIEWVNDIDLDIDGNVFIGSEIQDSKIL